MSERFSNGGERQYMLDHYGACRLEGACLCNKPGMPWLGTSCQNWTPGVDERFKQDFDRIFSSR